MKLLSEKLKENTLHAHREVEKCKGINLLMSTELTKSKYALILCCWLSTLKNPEQTINKSNVLKGVLDDFKLRCKSHLIESDLKELGIDYPSLAIESANIELANPAQIFGYAYVIEGSSLGAQFISKKLRKHAFMEEGHISFYKGYSDHTAKMWKGFKDSLDKWGQENTDKHEEVIQCALNTFDSIMSQMTLNFSEQNIDRIENQHSFI